MTVRFFLENDAFIKKFITKKNNPDAFHHIKDVLRMKENSFLELVFQKQIYLVKIKKISKQKIDFLPIKKMFFHNEIPKKVSLVVPFLKNRHLDFLVQKATELGVSEIILSSFQRSVVKINSYKHLKNKEIRLKKIIKGAAEQSHRDYVPSLTYEPDFVRKVNVCDHQQIGLVAWEESAKNGEKANLFKALNTFCKDANKKELIAIFGPEGGLTKSEVYKLKKRGFLNVGLGPRILRSETAPLYLLSCVSFLIELG